MSLLGLLALAVEDSANRFEWAIFAVLIVMALCWYLLSVTKDEKTNSLWKDKNTEMDDGSAPATGPGPEGHH